ncbi:protein SLC31A2 [Gadus morhua]|uniref:Copper transport protein n=1 Tax=Gadus morhua TaxID=8049 RepID=A0A8C5ADA7_GADMO|nr:probable low affinity copper uptake protein 2 [Gadus morhua]
MQMTFDASSSVTLLFDFWAVQSPPGMVLSVLVVCLFTVFFEFLKMWRIWLGSPLSGTKFYRPSYPQPCDGSPGECISVLAPGRSQSSLAPIQPPADTPIIANGWMLHSVQTALHVLQVAMSYMLMLCVMSYNVWIFLGVLFGAGLGYFLAYPLIGRISTT